VAETKIDYIIRRLLKLEERLSELEKRVDNIEGYAIDSEMAGEIAHREAENVVMQMVKWEALYK